MPDTKTPDKTANTCSRNLETRRSVQKIRTQLTQINCMRIYKTRTAASGEQKPPEKNRRHPPENVENRLRTMCRNNVEAPDKTGKAKRESRMQEAEALENCTVLHKIGRRIELQNPNGRENQAEISKDMTHNTRTHDTAKFGKKDKRGKASRTLLQRSSLRLPEHLLVVDICNSYYKRDLKYYNKNEKEKYPSYIFSRKNVCCVFQCSMSRQ